MKRTAFALAVAVGILVSISTAKATEPYAFLTDVINSFQSVHLADERIKREVGDDLVTQMKGIIVFNGRIREATRFVKPHLSSTNKLIKDSATHYYFIYSSIIDNNDDVLGSLENTLNDLESAAAKQDTFMRKLSENAARTEELRRMLVDATVLTTYCLVDQRRKEDGKVKFLTITSDERGALTEKLLGVFGEQIRGGPKAGQFPLEGSASLLYEFLSGGWKSADAK